MQRYFIDEDLKDKDCLILTGNDLHHLKNVMRSKNGEKIYNIMVDIITGLIYSSYREYPTLIFSQERMCYYAIAAT